MNTRALRVAGFLVAVLAAALMVTDVLDIGWGTALGVIGIGLIAMAKWNGLPSRNSTRARADAGGDAQMRDDKDSVDRRRSQLSAGAGVAIGTGVGAALSSATGDVFWIPLGIAIGAAIGGGRRVVPRRPWSSRWL